MVALKNKPDHQVDADSEPDESGVGAQGSDMESDGFDGYSSDEAGDADEAAVFRSLAALLPSPSA